MGDVRLLLGVETATRQSTVAMGRAGACLAVDRRTSEHRHGSFLLHQIDAVLDRVGADRSDIGAVAVGIGPGSFTGLRAGLATAKTIAYALGVPIVGIPSPELIAWAAVGTDAERGREEVVTVVLPAGARDHYLARVVVGGGRLPRLLEPPGLIPPESPVDDPTADRVIAIDVHEAARGRHEEQVASRALERLGEAVVALGTAALASREPDDVASLAPAYVALPRGVSQAAEQTTWSPDRR